LSEYGRSILDLTYITESQLIASSFPKERMGDFEEVQAKLETIRQFTLMYLRVNGKDEMKDQDALQKSGAISDIITLDQIEVVHWRKGALYFMLVSTLNQKNRKDEIQLEWFSKCLEELELMLSVRGFKTPDPESVGEAPELAKYGVWSSTHLLALLYGGEMCHWRTHLQPSRQVCQTGINMLLKYNKFVGDLPEAYGWNSSRSDVLLKILEGQLEQQEPSPDQKAE